MLQYIPIMNNSIWDAKIFPSPHLFLQNNYFGENVFNQYSIQMKLFLTLQGYNDFNLVLTACKEITYIVVSDVEYFLPGLTDCLLWDYAVKIQ